MNDKKILLNQYVPLIEKKMKMLETTLGNKSDFGIASGIGKEGVYLEFLFIKFK